MRGSGPSHEDQTLTHPRLKENDKPSERHDLSGSPSLTTSYRHPVGTLLKVIAKTALAAVSHMISIRVVRWKYVNTSFMRILWTVLILVLVDTGSNNNTTSTATYT